MRVGELCCCVDCITMYSIYWHIWYVCICLLFQKDAYLHNTVTMSVGAGTVADCWQMTERGSAFSFLFVGQFLGPLIGKLLLRESKSTSLLINCLDNRSHHWRWYHYSEWLAKCVLGLHRLWRISVCILFPILS